MKVCTAVGTAATAIPPRMRLVDDRPPSDERPSAYASPTPPTAPTNAASGTVIAKALPGPNATAIVAPSPPPPPRGTDRPAGSGTRPGTRPPRPTARRPPARRRSRAAVGCSPGSSRPAPTPRRAGLRTTPASGTRRSARSAPVPPGARTRTQRGGPPRRARSPESSSRRLRRLGALDRLDDRPEVVDDPRSPPGGDVVVERDHVVSLDGLDPSPARSLRYRLRRLAAALRVRQEDQVRVGGDDVLGGKLRIAAGRTLRLVGDVLEAHDPVELSDERVRRDRVVRVVELVVEAQPLDAGDVLRDRVDRLAEPSADLVGLLDVVRHEPELTDLVVHITQFRRRRLEERGDVDPFEGLGQAAGLRREDDEVGRVGRDRLDVGLVTGEIGLGGVRRIGRLVVDRDHLLTGSDREQHLGGGGRQRDDALRSLLERDVAGRRVDRDRVLDGGARDAACRTLGRAFHRRGVSARGQEDEDGGEAADEAVDHGASPFTRRRRSPRARAGLLTSGSPLARPLPRPGGPVVRVGSAPRSQWRDRAGLPPASLFGLERDTPAEPSGRRSGHSGA